MTRDQVEQRLGEPDATGKNLWAYNDLELFFYKGKLARVSKKGETIWPHGT